MKKQPFIYGLLLLVSMSSCVYSLFPIYTEDTVVFKEELLGKWDIDDVGSYMLFEKLSSENANGDVAETEEEFKYELEIKEGFTISSNDPIFITQNGRKIYDQDSIKTIMRERLARVEVNEEKKAADASAQGTATEDTKQESDKKLNPKDLEYEGTMISYEEKSYRLTVNNAKDEKQIYVAHLVEIGEDLFMDLYPVWEYNSKNISDNFFPVHTFYKIEVSEKEFKMTQFDLEKLNKLFESNLIRLRHEMVDGTVLITAQPKELQKFIGKYAKDDSVFETTETYTRAL